MKRWMIFSVIAAMLCAGSAGAASVPEQFSQKQATYEYTKQQQNKERFQLIDAKRLTKQEKAFVERVKVKEGIHRVGDLVVISLGKKPHAGYTLKYVDQYTVSGRTTVMVKPGKPDPRALYAQSVTYPHLIGKIKGNPKHVRFVNHDTGKELFQTERPFLSPVGVNQLTKEQLVFLNKVKHSQGIYRTGNIVIVSLGEKTSSGYGIQLVKQSVEADKATAYFKLTVPDPKKVYTQAVTYPYFLGKINLPANKPIHYINIDTGLELFSQATPIFQPVTENSMTASQLAFVNQVKSIKGIHRSGDFVVISLGQKNTAGYSLNIVSQKQMWEQVIISVKVNEPDPGKMHAQTITYPYVAGVVHVPPYTTLSFIDDRTGKPLFE